MVEKQEGIVHINDTGVSSKDDEKVSKEKREVTEYWDISGAMDSTSPSTTNLKMKLVGNEENMHNLERITDINDNVTTLTAENSTPGTLNDDEYCESDKSAIKTPDPRLGGNDNHNCNSNNNNNDILQLVSQNEDTPSKNKVMCKNVDPFLENKGENNDGCNVSRHQTEDNMVGNADVNDKGPESDVKDTVSENMVTSGIKDDCPEGENKATLSIREEMMLDSECTEERFRIDRKKLEQMLQAASEGRGQSGEAFFQNIMDDTNTFITWPSKLKIGAKSKKDPHIRICGKPDNIKEARHKIMLSLDTKSNRVTIKMDVSHTEHSHVIGKGGNNIKRVMQETGCHIHFPDSNRNTAGEKSNQVSITGHPEGVENARQKIRTLLPIVLQFEIPNTGLPIPDLNSPMIQHLVQVYGISIQFKQRAKVYSTSCTVRGSMDNTEGLKTGLQTLMNRVAGSQLPVTTQIEIAPQHHNYMLTKPSVNVTTITQTTGARIIFPDPSALPKKSTVYINGNIDSVILARHKLMGCLPLLLMFDMKDDLGNPSNDASKIAQLMESMDLSINIKSKPRQPSRTVIIKSIESNIYKMFEARANLLGLESSGISRPAQSLSPKLNRNATVTPTPVILLAHSHVPTPTAQTAVIGLTEQKTMTPLSGVVLNGPSYVLAPTVPSNTVTPRPLSTTMHTPSHSPFPAVQSNNITSSGPLSHEGGISAQQYVTSTISPPNMPLTQPTPLSSDQRRYQVNATSPPDVQRRINQRSAMHPNENILNSALNKPYVPNQAGYSVTSNQNGVPRQMSQLDEFTRSQQNLYSELNGLEISEQGRSFDDKRVLLSSAYDAQSILPGQLINQNDSRLMPQDQDQQTNINDRLQRPTGRHYPQGILSDEEYLRQQLGITDPRSRRDSDTSHVLLQNNMSQVSNNVRQPFGQNVRSPDSIGESRASITSDRNSPMSSISDRFNGNSNPRLDSLSSRDINSLSPVSNVSHHRSPPQIVLNQNLEGGLDSTGIADGPAVLEDISQTHSAVGEINPGPPPGFEGFTPAGHAPSLKTPDYENLCKLAKKAMENKPVHSEVRIPTDVWSGWGFSKSMPFGMKEELKKLAASKGRFRSNLPTTYENGEIPERNQPSPVDEEAEYNDLDNQVMNRSRMQFAEKGGSNFSAWRRRRLANMNLSMGGNMGLNYMSNAQRSSPQKHSAFIPIQPGESLNRAGSSPKNKPISESVPTSMQMKNVFNSSGNESTLRVPLLEKTKTYDTRMGMSNTPTIQDSLGLGSNTSDNTTTKVEPDISDVLNRLGLSKYIPVFQQQEVDYQTFLTLTEPDLKELGITTFGPRKKILLAISDLNKDRDVFSGPITNDSTVHENISDQMLQLQRLQLQQHRDNPQTTSSSRLDPHPLLSSNSRPMFNSQNLQDLDGPVLNRFIDDSKRNHRTNGLWQNSATGVSSNSGHW